VFQSFHLLGGMTAIENVMLPLELDGARDARDRAAALLDRVGLSARRYHYPTQLSGGEQQRVAIARAFATGPRVLFADEPTGNLDLATGQRIADILHALRAETGTALVLVTHDQQLAERCERRLLLRDGRLEPVA
jgi:putative ABC transport system ATP-binding protein